MTGYVGYHEPPPLPEDFHIDSTPMGDIVLECPACSWRLTVDPFDERADTLGVLLAEAVDHVGEAHPMHPDDDPDYYQ